LSLINSKAFNDTGAMYEKYIATEFGVSGGGGEYEVQKGFGWSNGVILDFLDRYGETLTATQATGELNDQKINTRKLTYKFLDFSASGDGSKLSIFLSCLPISVIVVLLIK
jgi:hypothetical protein